MRAVVASGALVAAIAAIVLVPNHPAGRVPSEDAGVFFYAARTLLDGGVPYRDVWDHKPPLVYLIDAAGLALAGPLGVWILQVVSLAAAAILGLRAMTRAFGMAPALVGTIAWLVASPRLFLADGQQTSYVEFFVLPLQMGALLVVARRPDLVLRRGDWVVLGVLAAAAALLKPTLAGTWFAIALVLVARRRVAALASIAGMSAVALATFAAVAAFFALRGAFGELLEQSLRYNLAYASFTPFVERLGAIPEGFRLVSPSGLAPLALAAWVWAAIRWRGAAPLVAIAVVALPLELVLATAGRAYHYYFLPWLPVMGVLVAYAAAEVRARLGPRTAGAVMTAAVVAMSVQPARLVARLATVGDDGTSRAAATYIADATAPGDTVLVWGARTEVLVLADRRSPTRYVYQYAALATRGYATPAAVDALIADLRARPPVLIVDASRASFVTPPLDREGLRAWVSPEPQYAWPPEAERIVAFVEAGYARAGEVNGWPVWRRR